MKKKDKQYPEKNIYSGEGISGDSFIEKIKYLGNNEWSFLRESEPNNINSKRIHEEKFISHQLYNELINLDTEDETNERIKNFKIYLNEHLESTLDIIYPLKKKLYPGFDLKVGLNKKEISFITSELDQEHNLDIIDVDLKTLIPILQNKRNQIRKEKMKGKRYPFGKPDIKTKYDSILTQLDIMKLFGNELLIR